MDTDETQMGTEDNRTQNRKEANGRGIDANYANFHEFNFTGANPKPAA